MHIGWEQKQAELWERIFQVTQDIVTLADSVGEGVGATLCKTEMVRAAMNVGRYVVRANAADEAQAFAKAVEEARLLAIEADYWLRLLYLIEQEEAFQRDLSSIINQYSAIVDLLEQLVRQPARHPKKTHA